MPWSLIIVVVVVGMLLLLKRMTWVSVETARKHLRQGALVIDVRTTEEFERGHLPDAMNIPLGELRQGLPGRVPDKNRPLLLHCLSGGRSAIASRQIKGMGYTNVFNLGSLSRARGIVGAGISP